MLYSVSASYSTVISFINNLGTKLIINLHICRINKYWFSTKLCHFFLMPCSPGRCNNFQHYFAFLFYGPAYFSGINPSYTVFLGGKSLWIVSSGLLQTIVGSTLNLQKYSKCCAVDKVGWLCWPMKLGDKNLLGDEQN